HYGLAGGAGAAPAGGRRLRRGWASGRRGCARIRGDRGGGGAMRRRRWLWAILGAVAAVCCAAVVVGGLGGVNWARANPPRIVGFQPAATQDVSLADGLRIDFDQPMQRDSTEPALQIAPEL